MDPRSASSKPGSSVLDGKYALKEKVGNGSFGHIYVAVNKEDGSVVAIKVEKRIPNTIITLSREAKILSELKGETGFPIVYDFGKDNDYNYLVLDLLGLDLEKLFKSCNYKFSLKTSLLIFEQMLTRIESLHQKGYIHRDIKPENFCISKTNKGELNLIDFGLARSYKDIHGKHITCAQKKGIVGTARYASINNHLGLEQSRRDDLEAIGYTMIYLMKGQLPWQNLQASNKNERYEMIANLKLTTPIPVLCKDLPSEFLTYMNYVRSLDFVETPDYKYLKGLFRALFIRSGFEYDYNYDWVRLKKKEKDELMSFEKLPRKIQKEASLNRPGKDQGKDTTNLVFENKLVQKVKDSDMMSPKQRQPRPSIELSPYKLIVSRELMDSNNDINGRNENVGDIKQFVSKTHGKINGFMSKEDNQTRTGFLLSENSPRNISTSSEHSSKMLNVSKAKFDDEEIPLEITLEISPSIKIKETIPLQAKTKNSYYVAKNQEFLQLGTSREPRRRTFVRTYSERASNSTDDKKGKIKPVKAPLKERYAPIDEKRVDGDDGENLNESSIGEWARHSQLKYMMDQRNFITNMKHS